MAALVHLVCHTETDNPQHLVQGSVPGFALSPHGLDQARRVGRYLGPRAVVAVWSSPVERALRTAEEIAARSGVPVRVDDGLGEWKLMDRWSGHSWASLKEVFPGELEAYLTHPHDMDFAPETLAELSERVAEAARRLDAAHPHGDVVLVSHQDAVQAGRLRLTGSGPSEFPHTKPGHGAVVTLRPGVTWVEETIWEPVGTRKSERSSELRVVAAGLAPDSPGSA